jgi:hypothetical protein
VKTDPVVAVILRKMTFFHSTISIALNNVEEHSSGRDVAAKGLVLVKEKSGLML